MPRPGIGWLADFGGGFPDGLVDVPGIGVDFLADVLAGLQRRLVDLFPLILGQRRRRLPATIAGRGAPGPTAEALST
jgi:hypothetical protein